MGGGVRFDKFGAVLTVIHVSYICHNYSCELSILVVKCCNRVGNATGKMCTDRGSNPGPSHTSGTRYQLRYRSTMPPIGKFIPTFMVPSMHMVPFPLHLLTMLLSNELVRRRDGEMKMIFIFSTLPHPQNSALVRGRFSLFSFKNKCFELYMHVIVINACCLQHNDLVLPF